MAFCKNCGTKVEEGTGFCPSCGAPVESIGAAQNNENTYVGAPIVKSGNGGYSDADIQNGKAMGILSYLSILVLISLFTEKNNQFVRYHINQGLVLLIAEVIYCIAYGILSSVFLMISWRLYFLVSIIGLVSILFLVLSIIGIVNVANGTAKELPILGKIQILK